MTELDLFKTGHLSAAQSVLALHQPEDRTAEEYRCSTLP